MQSTGLSGAYQTQPISDALDGLRATILSPSSVPSTRVQQSQVSAGVASLQVERQLLKAGTTARKDHIAAIKASNDTNFLPPAGNFPAACRKISCRQQDFLPDWQETIPAGGVL